MRPDRFVLLGVACTLIIGLAAGSGRATLSRVESRKPADKCQQAIAKVGTKTLAAQLKAYSKCTLALLDCVQKKAAAPACIAAAGEKCRGTLLEKIPQSETDASAKISKACISKDLSFADLVISDGLGLGRLAPSCRERFGINMCTTKDVVDCLVGEHARTAAELASFAQPQSADLILLPHVLPTPLAYFHDYKGCGQCSVVPDKATGAKVSKCGAAIAKATTAFSALTLTSVEACLGKIVTCDQTKPGDAGCLTKAGSLCTKNVQKLATARAKLTAKIESTCSDGLAFSNVAGGDGLNFAALGDDCANLDVQSLAGVDAVAECLGRRHECAVAELASAAVARVGAPGLPALPGLDTFLAGGPCPDLVPALEPAPAPRALSTSISKFLSRVRSVVGARTASPKLGPLRKTVGGPRRVTILSGDRRFRAGRANHIRFGILKKQAAIARDGTAVADTAPAVLQLGIRRDDDPLVDHLELPLDPTLEIDEIEIEYPEDLGGCVFELELATDEDGDAAPFEQVFDPATPTPTVSPTGTPGPTPSPTRTATPLATVTSTPVGTATVTVSPTPATTATSAVTSTPTSTNAGSPTVTPIATKTATPIATATSTNPGSPTTTPTPLPCSSTQAILCGTLVESDLTTETEHDCLTFTAAAGDVVSLNLARVSTTSGSFSPSWQLYAADGSVIGLTTGSIGQPCTGQCESQPLPSAGLYTFRISNDSFVGSGGYNAAFEALTASFAGNPNGPPAPTCKRDSEEGPQVVSCGVTETRQFTKLGETDTFTFTADAGEVLSITAVALNQSSVVPIWRLFRADGAIVPLANSNAGSQACYTQCRTLPLPAGDVFTLEVTPGSNQNTGQYTLTVEPISDTFDGHDNGPPSPFCAVTQSTDGTQPVACGETRAGQIQKFGETDTFTFTADVNDVASIKVANVSTTSGSFDPVWRLYDRDGNPVPLSAPNDLLCGSQCETQPLLTSGVFTVQVFDNGHEGSGLYTVGLESVTDFFDGAFNGPPAPACASPDGDGTQPISCGITVSGDIDPVGETDTFTFTGKLNEVASISVAPLSNSGGFQPQWRLFGPTGALITTVQGSPLCSSECAVVLPTDGVFTIVVASSLGKGSYNLSLDALSKNFDGLSNAPPNPICRHDPDGTQPILCGTSTTGEIDPVGEADTFTFLAQKNDVVSIATTRLSTYSGSFLPTWHLFDAGGSIVPLFNGNTGDDGCYGVECHTLPLPAGGVFTIRVSQYPGGGPGSGSYTLDMEAVSGSFNNNPNGPPAPTCQRNQEGTQPLSCGTTLLRQIDFGDIDTFSFTAKAGNVVAITTGIVSTIGGTFSPYWELFRPNGARLTLPNSATSCSGQCETAPLPADGTYTIKVASSGNAASGMYNVTLEALTSTFASASNGPPMPTCQRGTDGTQPMSCGDTLSRAINGVGETDTFTFEATSSQSVRINVVSTGTTTGSFDPAWKLFSPTGAVVPLANGGADNSCSTQCDTQPLTTPGVLTLKVFDRSTDGAGTYDVTVGDAGGSCP